MDETLLIPMVAGAAVVLLFGVGFMLTKSSGSTAEQRLEGMTGGKAKRSKADLASGLLLRPPAIELLQSDFWTKWIPNLENLNLLYEQADVNLPFNRFLGIVGGLTATGAVLALAFQLPYFLVPICALFLGVLPFFWLMRRKKRRIKLFLDSMPEAVELISRALRAGHGLASGLQLVAQEMKGPIAYEFARVFEEQNLGIPIELSLRGLAERIPSMDVRFFSIAVIIQRSTGGDLAEVLDKIGRLIRQRFELNGHVRSLTAEGRLSGIVLLALPPGLLGFLSFSNYEYVSPLYLTALGTKMLIATAILQFLGALSINKIVAIKV